MNIESLSDRVSVALVMDSDYFNSYSDEISDDASVIGTNRGPLEYSVLRLYNEVEVFRDGGRDTAG